MERRSHNHGLDPSCNEHPTGDCIIQELLDRLEASERDLAAVTVSRDGWKTRAEVAEKAVAAVEALHTPASVNEAWGTQGRYPGDDTACLHCTSPDDSSPTPYPCPTITALDGAPNA